jgi:uncharacterized protein YfaA (DUF2138 family)
VVVDGQIVIRPIMVVALTYDHRLLDGREAVTFLGMSARPVYAHASHAWLQSRFVTTSRTRRRCCSHEHEAPRSRLCVLPIVWSLPGEERVSICRGQDNDAMSVRLHGSR